MHKERIYIVHSIQIFNFQLILILYEMYFIIDKKIITIINKNKVKKAFIVFLIPFILFSIANGANGANELRDKLKLSANLLDRIIYLESNKISELNFETREILYSLHQNSIPLKFKIPDDGVLDTAIGVDPSIIDLFKGSVYFELSISQNKDGKKSQTIFKKNIELSSLSEEEFCWRDININLSKYSGKKIILNLNKGYENYSQANAAIIYDFSPIDFIYWGVPNIRSKKVKDKYNIILVSLDTLRITVNLF